LLIERVQGADFLVFKDKKRGFWPENVWLVKYAPNLVWMRVSGTLLVQKPAKNDLLQAENDLILSLACSTKRKYHCINKTTPMEHNFRQPYGQPDPTVLLADKNGWYYARLSEIVYCVSDNSYTEVYLTNGEKLIVTKPLKYYEQLTAPFGFLRIHQSYLINTMHLLSITRLESIWHALLANDYLIPISRDRKTLLLEKLEKQSLTDAGAYYQKPAEPIAIKPKRETVLKVNREFVAPAEEKVLNVHTG
jgi:hypothetical protein